YILSQSFERKKDLLRSFEVRNNLLTNPEYHYTFVWLVQDLDEESIKYLLDEKLLYELLSSNTDRLEDKFNAIMTSGKDYVNVFLNNEIFFGYLIKAERLWLYLSSLDLTFSKRLFTYVLNNDIKNVNIITKFNENAQLEILDDELIHHLKELGINFSFINHLQPAAMSKLVNKPLLLENIINYYPDDIAYIASLNISFPLNFQTNEEVIGKFVNIKEIDSYRFLMNKLAVSNQELYDNIQRKRNIKYDKYVNSIDTLDESVNKKELVEVLIDRYFEDVAYNFSANLKEMLNYIKDSNEELINDELKSVYSMILNYQDYSLGELVVLYNELNNGTNYVELFYDDYQRLKNHFYNDVNARSIKAIDINTNPSFIKEGVSVLELTGEKFIAIAHTSRGLHKNNEPNTTSLSLIGDKHIGFFGSVDSLRVGFDYLPNDQIMNVHDYDSFSSQERGTDRINQIRPVEKILEGTTVYNEILLYQKTEKTEGNFAADREFIVPSYLIALNKLTDEIIELAKLHNLPILLIHEEYYYTSDKVQDDFDSTYSTEKNRKSF
ncbi:MAG TPA: hypothetical protein GX708_10315, partial [Gallicola sp.]|nr:hypothetical protein [Gallicola sp.]